MRRLVGYGRFEGIETARALAHLYAVARLRVNYFQPSFKLKEKHRPAIAPAHYGFRCRDRFANRYALDQSHNGRQSSAAQREVIICLTTSFVGGSIRRHRDLIPPNR